MADGAPAGAGRGSLKQVGEPTVYLGKNTARIMRALLTDHPASSKLEDSREIPGRATVPCSAYAELQSALNALNPQALYAQLRELGTAETDLVSTAWSLGVRLREGPEPHEPGYTCWAHYAATGEGARLWYLRCPQATDEAEARRAFETQFFAGDPDTFAFYAQGLHVIRSEYVIPMSPDAEPGSTPECFEVYVNNS